MGKYRIRSEEVGVASPPSPEMLIACDLGEANHASHGTCRVDGYTSMALRKMFLDRLVNQFLRPLASATTIAMFIGSHFFA